MTVKELIERLQAVSDGDDLEIIFFTNEHGIVYEVDDPVIIRGLLSGCDVVFEDEDCLREVGLDIADVKEVVAFQYYEG